METPYESLNQFLFIPILLIYIVPILLPVLSKEGSRWNTFFAYPVKPALNRNTYIQYMGVIELLHTTYEEVP